MHQCAHHCNNHCNKQSPCGRAKGARKDSQTSIRQAATKGAEMMAQHKSSMRRSQAAQSPLPPLDGKKASTPAQPRRRTAKVFSKAVPFSIVGPTAYNSSVCSSLGQIFQCKFCKIMLTFVTAPQPRGYTRRRCSRVVQGHRACHHYHAFTCVQTNNNEG